jgi:hypothetical protein
VQLYTLSKTSLAKAPSSVTELYIPLWVADGTSVSTTSNQAFLKDGSSSTNGSTPTTLFTLSPTFPPTTKFAIEATIWVSNASAGAGAQLYDVTASAAVVNASVQTQSTSAVVVRSGQFTLIPGHSYGVYIFENIVGGYTAYCCDVSLIVFP